MNLLSDEIDVTVLKNIYLREKRDRDGEST